MYFLFVSAKFVPLSWPVSGAKYPYFLISLYFVSYKVSQIPFTRDEENQTIIFKRTEKFLNSHLLSFFHFPSSDTMIQVVASFSMEPSLDVVLSSIPAWIYEAVHYQQENMESFTAKVR